MESLHADSGVRYKPICERPDLYRIGDDGTIQSQATGAWRAIKPWRSGKGDHVIGIWTGNRTVRRKIAHLVLEAFVGLRPLGMVCRHLDGDRNNNNLSNLAWGTPSENVRDSVLHGTHGVT